MIASLTALAALAAVHVAAPALDGLRGIPRSRWLSFAGGTAVAYVFVHLLPELAESQRALEEAGGALPFVERHAYLLALLGLTAFYGVALHGRRAGARSGPAAAVGIGAFALYNGTIGYLLADRGREGGVQLILFAAAMGIHFLVTDYGLEERHGAIYRRLGRILVVGALAAGWLLGVALDLSQVALALPTAFLAGGLILNVLAEDLPEDRRSRFSGFAAGAGAYAALLVALDAA